MFFLSIKSKACNSGWWNTKCNLIKTERMQCQTSETSLSNTNTRFLAEINNFKKPSKVMLFVYTFMHRRHMPYIQRISYTFVRVPLKFPTVADVTFYSESSGVSL